MQLSFTKIEAFRKTVWSFYRAHGRQFPWRHEADPYRVLVSEIMLQQTQTHRVEPKYELFLETFPVLKSLARASLQELLRVWQGLGYNRRALYLRDAARVMVDEHDGCVPNDPKTLQQLPGIGPGTAGAVCAYAFNCPAIFIETNIRTVFIHHFFRDQAGISDRQIEPLVGTTLDQSNPRDWYYALTDYGVMLKAKHGNPSRQSKHHVRQSKFEGSDRQIRGAIIRMLTCDGSVSPESIIANFGDAARVGRIIDGLVADRLVVCEGDLVTLREG